MTDISQHPSQTEVALPAQIRAALQAARIAVVIPCYRVERQIRWVVEHIPDYVRYIIAVNDASPDRTPELLTQLLQEHAGRLTVVNHLQNKGVGGAVITGYRTALQLGARVIVKIDGDGQMDPSLLPLFVLPLIRGKAEYVKGNRFHNLVDSTSMPLARRIGNLSLSFLMRAASGYWNLLDPTNGYTAISARVLRALNLDSLERRYLFESSMLVQLYRIRARVMQVPMKAIYGDESSSLNVRKVSLQLSVAFVKWLVARVAKTYFWDDFGIVSVFLLFGTLLMTFGLSFGIYNWIMSAQEGVPATAGTVMLASIPVILGLEFLINALVQDTQNVPSSPPPILGPLDDESLLEWAETMAPKERQ